MSRRRWRHTLKCLSFAVDGLDSQRDGGFLLFKHEWKRCGDAAPAKTNTKSDGKLEQTKLLFSPDSFPCYCRRQRPIGAMDFAHTNLTGCKLFSVWPARGDVSEQAALRPVARRA